MNKKGPIINKRDFDKTIRAMDKVIVLFYASWCPYSKRFLPVFEKYAKDYHEKFRKVMLDDMEDLAGKYSVSVYPTVLFFEGGKVSRRLDGLSGEGLNEGKLTNFISVCGLD